jgi:hypothetical protein
LTSTSEAQVQGEWTGRVAAMPSGGRIGPYTVDFPRDEARELAEELGGR